MCMWILFSREKKHVLMNTEDFIKEYSYFCIELVGGWGLLDDILVAL